MKQSLELSQKQLEVFLHRKKREKEREISKTIKKRNLKKNVAAEISEIIFLPKYYLKWGRIGVMSLCKWLSQTTCLSVALSNAHV